MATLQQTYDLGQDTKLKERVLAALVRKSAFVRTEDVTGMSAPKIAQRQNLAYQARVATEGLVAAATRACAQNATIQTAAYAGGPLNTVAVADADIEYVLDVEWDALAGVAVGA